MSTDILKEFKRTSIVLLNIIKLIIRTKKNLIVGTINEWIIDNYYVISQLEKILRMNILVKS